MKTDKDKREDRRYVFTFFILVLTSATLLSGMKALSKVEAQPSDEGFAAMLTNLDKSRLVKHLEFFSSLGSRVTGYPGFYEASNYIADRFKELGLKVIIQNYTVACPIDGDDYIVLKTDDRLYRVKAFSLWPNLVQTCKTPLEGVSGKLFYAGDGGYQSLKGKPVNGSIVLMDFNSGDSWVLAAALGAKGVVFIEPEESNYAEARSKFLLTPVYLPRLYISRNDALFVLNLLEENNGEIDATIVNNMTLKNVVGQNIIAILEGTDYPNDVIIVSTHYDTWSVVPAIASSEDEATSISALLEFARVFSGQKPKRTIWFVAFSGHYQALAGSRAFVDEFFYNNSVVEGRTKIWLQINMDFSTSSKSISFLSQGFFYRYGSTTVQARWTGWLQTKLMDIVDAFSKEVIPVEVIYGFPTNAWWGSQVSPYILDSEPLSMAHGLGFTIKTGRTLNFFWGLPLSQDVRYDNLWPQVYLSLAVIHELSNSKDWGIRWDQVSPAVSGRSRTLIAAGATDVAGFIRVYGRTLTFNITKGWYTLLPNATVVVFPGGLGYTNYPFQIIYVFSDSEGKFEVRGLGYGLAPCLGAYTFLAFRLNSETGLIEYAPDFGQYGAQYLPNYYQLNTEPYNVTTIAFRSNTVVFFNIFDYQGLRPLIFRDPRVPTNIWLQSIPSVQLLNAKSLGPDISWGVFLHPDDKILVAFVQPHTYFVSFMTIGSTRVLEVLLTNTSVASIPPYDFSGYSSKDNEEIHLNALLESAKNIYTTSLNRYVGLRDLNIWNPLIQDSLNNALFYRSLLSSSSETLDYLKMLQSAVSLNSIVVRSYGGVMGLINDIPTTSIFLIIILAVFSFLAPAVFIRAQGRVVAASSGVLFIMMMLLLYYVNPIFKLAANFIMAPLSVIVVVFFVIVTILFSSEALNTLKTIRRKTLGSHFAEKSLTSFTLVIFPYTIEHMKRRKLRTSLVMLSIASVVFAFVSLTSVSIFQAPMPSTIPEGKVNYMGICIKTNVLQQPAGAFNYDLVNVLKQERFADLSLIVSPRTWWYPEAIEGRDVYTFIKTNTSSTAIKAVIGLTPEEYHVYDYSKALIQGRWFNSEDYYSAILPLNIAEDLSVKVGDTIIFEGLRLKVVGIANSSTLNSFVDFDGYIDTPLYPILPSIVLGTVQEPQYAPTPWNMMLILPHDLVKDMGGYLASVSIVTKSYDDAATLAEIITRVFSIPIYVSSPEGAKYYSPIVSFAPSGLSFALPLIVIGAASISVAVLGSVKERRGDIFVYSAVGLPPSGSAIMLIIEAVAYSILSVVPAYFLGVVANSLLISGKFLPESFSLNATSLSIALAIFAGILSTLLAMVYPIRIASKLITPSLERKWKIPTKPKGDLWDIPLPFSLTDEREVEAVYLFLEEFFKARTSETPDPFIVRSIRTGLKEKVQELLVSLMPLDSGVYQRALINSKFYEDTRKYDFVLRLERIEGTPDTWVALNYGFIDAVRKQLLTWKMLSDSDKSRYIELVDKGGMS
ncbi:M28 family peptidase [Candidatus Bathyarchaeota archaeon]|nr:M28 family peptidase [Candidatus Bathyarchaeota archaeon]